MKDLIHLDLFSGCGAFNKGFCDAGYTFKKQYFSEIDKHAIANYRYNFPNAEYVGSVTDVQLTERPNIITFGSPCQDFSLAGKRKGLEGGRSSLITYAIGLIERFRPDVFIWENVKGAFSSMLAQIFGQLSKPLPTLAVTDLNGNLLIQHGFYPKIESGYTLSDILQTEVDSKYFLSEKTIAGLMKGQQKTQILEH